MISEEDSAASDAERPIADETRMTVVIEASRTDLLLGSNPMREKRGHRSKSGWSDRRAAQRDARG